MLSGEDTVICSTQMEINIWQADWYTGDSEWVISFTSWEAVLESGTKRGLLLSYSSDEVDMHIFFCNF